MIEIKNSDNLQIELLERIAKALEQIAAKYCAEPAPKATRAKKEKVEPETFPEKPAVDADLKMSDLDLGDTNKQEPAALTLDDLKKEITAMKDKLGHTAVIFFFQRFALKHISQVKDDQINEMIDFVRSQY